MTAAMKPTDSDTVDAAQLSADAVKTVVLAAVSCILYVRCLLPEDHFVPMTYDNVAIKVLRPKSSEASILLYKMLDNGVFDAIERQYLRKLTITIIASVDRRDESLESYHLNFSYPQVGVFAADAELRSKNHVQAHKLGHFNSPTKLVSQKLLAQQVHRFMRSLVMVLQTLQTLPINCYLDMHLEYNDSTPADYEPMFFRASDIVPHLVLPVKMTTSLSIIDTPCHSVKLDFETTAGGLVREPTQPLSSPIRKDAVHLLNGPEAHADKQVPAPHTAGCHANPNGPNSDDTILDDLENENDDACFRSTRHVSLQPCESSAADMAAHAIDNDSPTQTQWSQSQAQLSATIPQHRDADSPAQLDTPPPPPPAPAHPTTVISLLTASSDDQHRQQQAATTTVDCLCGLNDSDGGMLQCEHCHAWMHVVCYGYLYVKDPRLPERFVCAKCDTASGKFLGVSREALRELGLFRSAVSVIWNERPVDKSKNKKPKSGSQQTKNEADGHVWRDTELAARLFITVPQANALLARAVDEHIASWHARGKIAKKAQVLVLVHKQSNDARRALHVLFNPALVSLPARGSLLTLESTLAPGVVARGKPAVAAASGHAGGERSKQVMPVVQQQSSMAMLQMQQQASAPVYLSQASSQAGSQTQVDSQTQFSLSPTHPMMCLSHPPGTTGTVIPASITPPNSQSQMYGGQAAQPYPGGTVGQRPTSMHHLASSLDLLRVTNQPQTQYAPASGQALLPRPCDSGSPMLVMSHTSAMAPAPLPGTVLGTPGPSTCSTLYHLHHPTYHGQQPPRQGSETALMTPGPESSGTLRWMPDSQMQTLTDGSIVLGSSLAATAPTPPQVPMASPVMLGGEQRPKVYKPMKRKHGRAGEEEGGMEEGNSEVKSKKVKRSAAQRPARMPTP